MFHVAAFSGSVGTSTTALTNIAPVSDPSLRINGNFLYVPTLTPQFLGAYSWGAGVTQAQLQSPSLRQFALYDVAPLDQSVDVATPPAFVPRFSSPYPLQPNEALQALITQTGSTNYPNSIAVWFGDGPLAPVNGQIITVRFTATNTSGTYGWNNLAITLSQNLPVGQYTCVGARVEEAHTDLFRFYPVGSTYRPGGLGNLSVKTIGEDAFRYGGLGNWFDFDQLVLPSIDVFSTTGSGSIVGYMDLIKKS